MSGVPEIVDKDDFEDDYPKMMMTISLMIDDTDFPYIKRKT